MVEGARVHDTLAVPEEEVEEEEEEEEEEWYCEILL
jgi:hypothetical protein